MVAALERGGPAAAEAPARALLEMAPEHPGALRVVGAVALAAARHEEAALYLGRAVKAAPTFVEAWAELARTHLARKAPGEAVRCVERALRLAPQLPQLHHLHGQSCRASGNHDAAADAFRRAIWLDPNNPDHHDWLGYTLMREGHVDGAIAAFETCVRLRGSDTGLRDIFSMLTRMYTFRGDVAGALRTVDRWAALLPTDGEPPHLRAALTQVNVPSRASDEAMVAHFDGFASTFDEILGTIRYVGHEATARAVSGVLAGVRVRRVLDAGCGTGLAGPSLRHLAIELWGVDLSPKMLDLARARSCYDRLELGEMTSYLQCHTGEFDVVASSDTLIYFGDLEPLATAVAAALAPGGRFAFTVELADAGTFELRMTGRYAHSEAYVAHALSHAGLSIERTERLSLRLEHGVPVPGLVVVARRS